jgi:hypothetical protein
VLNGHPVSIILTAFAMVWVIGRCTHHGFVAWGRLKRGDVSKFEGGMVILLCSAIVLATYPLTLWLGIVPLPGSVHEP